MAIPYPQKIQPIILTEPQIQDYQAMRRPRKMAIELCPVDADFVGTLLSSRYFMTICRSEGFIINDNDIAAIREHELISQFFSSLSGVVSALPQIAVVVV